MASLRPGKEVAQDAWQFATPDLLERLRRLAESGGRYPIPGDAIEGHPRSEQGPDRRPKGGRRADGEAGRRRHRHVKDLVAERTNLIQFEIQARKDIRDQEEAVRLSHRTEATLARQLQQAGLEPTMLRSAAAEGDIVVAEVPERLMTRVKLGMTCEVRFYALPNRVFTGKVSGISPVISKDSRVLNVQFVVKDPQGMIRPGMFAEVGLGTDKRQSLLMPADGVLHVEDKDYALVAGGAGNVAGRGSADRRVAGSDVEVLSGLKAGDRVLGKGAILLKPVVVRCLHRPARPRCTADEGRGRRRP